MDRFKREILRLLAILALLLGHGDFSKLARKMAQEKARKAIERLLP